MHTYMGFAFPGGRVAGLCGVVQRMAGDWCGARYGTMRAIVVALLVLCGASRTDALPAFAGLPHLPAPTHLPPHNLKHIVLATVGFRGHYMPLLRLGAELATRGYRVSVATHSNAQDDVLRAGLHVRSRRRA